MAFDNGVSAPGGVSYAAPLMRFDQFANWAADDPYKKIFDQQQQQLNQQQIQQGQQRQDIAATFKGGLPVDPQTGQVDYKKAVAMLAQKGDVAALWNGADAMAVQNAGVMSPLLSGGGQPAQGQPTSLPAKPLPAPAANSPQGDPGSGTIASLVTDRLPNQDTTTGQTIAKIAQTIGVDPNATLTPGQMRRAQGLLQRYAPGDGSSGGQGGSLPPSANAVSPAPKAAAPSSAPAGFADRFAAAGPQGSLPPQPQQPPPIGAGSPGQQPQPAAPQPPADRPITPQVPLPKGFTDPQAAILALRQEAARLSANQRAHGQVQELNNWAKRIEDSIAPVDVNPNTTRLDARTGQILYQGPGAAAMGNSRETGATLDADAESYRQTGKLPPNMGRGIQGQQESNAIRRRAAEMEIAEGGNPADWSSRWQSFATQAAGKRALETRAAGLSLAENEASSLIPRVREISGKIKRTEYPTLNSLILASQKGSGGQDVIKLGIAVESLVPVYARVLKPVGQVGQGDMARAHDILDKAWSDGQINAALDQMQVELKSARTALDKTMSESENRGKAKRDAVKKTSEGAASGTTPGGVKWSVE